MLSAIEPGSTEKKQQTKDYLNKIAKPLGSLGMLEDTLARLGAIDALKRDYRPCVAVMCADNGVVCEGVTQTGSEVTANVAGNMTRGESTVCIMAKTIGVEVFPYDAGMLCEVDGVPQIKVMRGTKNLYREPAMTVEQAKQTILAGAEVARALVQKGYDLIAVGEMGIGNTTTSAALTAVLTGAEASEVTGKGAGLSDAGLKRKIEVIQHAIELHHPDPNDVLDTLSKVGGLDIAAMAGVFLGCAAAKVPAVLDGYISCVAALVACRISPSCVDYLIPSHCSKEPGAVRVLDAIGLKPMLSLGMALGEGTGAVTLLPMLKMAAAVYFDMPTFTQIGVEAYQKL